MESVHIWDLREGDPCLLNPSNKVKPRKTRVSISYRGKLKKNWTLVAGADVFVPWNRSRLEANEKSSSTGGSICCRRCTVFPLRCCLTRPDRVSASAAFAAGRETSSGRLKQKKRKKERKKKWPIEPPFGGSNRQPDKQLENFGLRTAFEGNARPESFSRGPKKKQKKKTNKQKTNWFFFLNVVVVVGGRGRTDRVIADWSLYGFDWLLIEKGPLTSSTPEDSLAFVATNLS